MKSIVSVFSIICLLSVSGCAVMRRPSSEQVDIEDQHFLSVSQDGEFRFPENRNLTPRDKFDLIFHGIEEFLRKRGEEKNLVIYIHGGLNSYDDCIERAEKSMKAMNDTKTFPVFITWRSDYLSTLGDHYFHVRYGETSKYAPFTSPIYMIGDLFKTIGNIPMAWFQEGYQMVTTSWFNDDQEDLDRDLCNYPKEGIDIALAGQDDRKRWNPQRKAVWFLTAPIKLITTPFVVTFGEPSWNNMKRRTSTMFMSENDLKFKEDDADAEETAEYEVPPSGAAQIFLRELNARIKEFREINPNFKVTLIGHSMGAIIINQALLSLPEFDVDNIVYMASADNLQNYINVTKILLQNRRRQQKNLLRNKRRRKNDLNIYNLFLHPENENREIRGFGTAPSGSLLAWVDHSYGAPEYVLQRTAGRWTNMRKILDVIPNKDRQFHHFKIFGRASHKVSPQQHGDFDEFRFWDKSFWTGEDVCQPPDGTGCYVE